ncbi:glycosyltransferase family 4 protein [Leifsonia flava]|uniref:Glycosyltransferase n=1 Tax=Orlajensenia leifsoniae TaxID=2561933 RepID=A0A4Y9QYX5_9MICO|nr:glycosyltransferase family 4 protein [Leifsonia flava]TFV96958.1 glycosyltransferase [Leifsonia flava]
MVVIGNSLEALDERGSESLSICPELEGSRPIVGAIIRLTDVKKLHLLVEAAHLLQQTGSPVTIVLVGEGPEREPLAALARKLGVDLRILPSMYDAVDIARIYSAMKVCVVPAAIGLTAIQSLQHGTPVISDDDAYGQMPEWESIRPGVTGDHYRKGDVADLASAIARWVDNTNLAADEISENCLHEVALNWSVSRQLELIVSAVQATIACDV